MSRGAHGGHTHRHRFRTTYLAVAIFLLAILLSQVGTPRVFARVERSHGLLVASSVHSTLTMVYMSLFTAGNWLLLRDRIHPLAARFIGWVGVFVAALACLFLVEAISRAVG